MILKNIKIKKTPTNHQEGRRAERSAQPSAHDAVGLFQ